MDFIRAILTDAPDERFAYFLALAKRGNTDRGMEHKYKFPNLCAFLVTKTVFLWEQRARRGQASPLWRGLENTEPKVRHQKD